MWIMIAAGALSAVGPTYLNCYLEQGGGHLPVEVVTDEANQRATVSLPSGRVVQRIAVFTPTEVRVSDDQMVWKIDRVSLEFQRVTTIQTEHIEVGKCEVKPVPADRVF